MKLMKTASPCPACKGRGQIEEISPNTVSTRPGSIMEVINRPCTLCQGYRCVWIEPIIPERLEK